MDAMLNSSSSSTKFPVWLGALAALWLLILLTFPISHNDTWWQLKCGEWLWQHNSFPEHDPFSYSSELTTWLRQSWLFEVLAWPVFAWGGAAALVSAKLCVALAAAILAARFSMRRGAAPPISLAFAALAFVATRFSWTERPQTTAGLSFVIALMLLDLPRSRARSAALFAISVLWGNLSGSVVLLPVFALAWELGAWLEGGRLEWKSPLACVAGSFCNPQYGGAYLDVLNFYGPKLPMRELISEWKAPALRPDSPLTWLFMLLPFSLVAAAKQKRWRVMLLLLASAAGALKVGRLAPFFALGTAMWSPVFLKFQRQAWMQRSLALVLLGHGSWMLSKERLWTNLVDAQQFPIQASEFLARERPSGRLGNLYRDGAYLLFRLGPETRVFIDSREFIYPENVFRAAYSLEAGSPLWKKIARDFQFSCMLLPRQSRLFEPMLSDKGWKLVYFDKDFALVATDAELKSHHGRWPCYEGVDLIQMSLINQTHATTLALQQRPADAQGLYLLGLCYLNEGKIDLAKSSVQKSLALDPAQTVVRDLNARLALHSTK